MTIYSDLAWTYRRLLAARVVHAAIVNGMLINNDYDPSVALKSYYEIASLELAIEELIK